MYAFSIKSSMTVSWRDCVSWFVVLLRIVFSNLPRGHADEIVLSWRRVLFAKDDCAEHNSEVLRIHLILLHVSHDAGQVLEDSAQTISVDGR